jgi:ABC-type polysaccharide/polyol phosphate export permease
MSAYLLAAYLPFMFFSMALMDATGSVLANLPLVKKIYFPREILPLTAIISNFIHFLFALVMFFFYLLVVWIVHPGQIPFQWTTIYLPVILVINLLFVAGLGLMLSAWNTFYEDVKYMVGLGTSMLLFLSPIMWLSEGFNHEHHWQYVVELILNPMTILCNSYRRMLLAPPSWTETPAVLDKAGHIVKPAVVLPALPIQWKYIGYLAVVSIFIFLLGYKIFNARKWKFVERP